MEIARQLHLDLVALTWLALVVALPVFWCVRQATMTRWNEHGNISTDPFGVLDLILVVVLFLFIGNLPEFLSFFDGQTAVEPARETAEVRIRSSHLFAGALNSVFLIVILLSVLYWRREVSIDEIFGLRRMSWKSVLGWGILIGAFVTPLVLFIAFKSNQLLGRFVGDVPAQPLTEAFLEKRSLEFRCLVAFTALIVAPLYEELFYRGYLYTVVKRYSDRFFAAVFSSLVFALSHPGLTSYVPIFILGMFLVIAYELSGCLWVPICMHIFFNLANLVNMVIALLKGDAAP